MEISKMRYEELRLRIVHALATDLIELNRTVNAEEFETMVQVALKDVEFYKEPNATKEDIISLIHDMVEEQLT